MARTKTENLKVPCAPELKAALLVVAERLDVPLAQVIRTACRQYLQAQEADK